MSLLGFKASQALGLIEVLSADTSELDKRTQEHPKVFSDLDCLEKPYKNTYRSHGHNSCQSAQKNTCGIT